MNMNGKIALVTGASRGFGAAAAEALAAKGAHVIALARTTGALEELDDRIQSAGGSATLVPLDIKDQQGLQRLSLSVHDRWGGLDLWVHSAIHAPPLSPVGHVSDKDFDTTTEINLRATHRLICCIDPLLAAKQGTAVHVDDPRAGDKFFGAYGATKAAQKSLNGSWAAESSPGGVSITTFTPDPMPTATRARFFPGEDRAGLSPPMSQAASLLAYLGVN